MANVLALAKLYADVVARFALESPEVAMPFGWRAPAKQFVGSRIAWVPGDPAGDVGRDAPARNPGRNPRSLATLVERFHCVISASDLTAPESELAQYVAARHLRDAWQRALYLAAHGTYAIESQRWNIDRQNERRFGATILAVCTIQSMVADEQLAAAPADVRIVADLSELDLTEPITT